MTLGTGAFVLAQAGDMPPHPPAGILAGVRVQRTARSDSTALGAATLAGLAADVWDGPDALAEIPVDSVAEPELGAAERGVERERWAEARGLTSGWR